MYVVIVDTVGIQPYIFGSNRLKENIGASFLVAQATTGWAENCSPAGMEKLYAGGGNFVALAEDEMAAKAFVQALSRKVLLEAPGLQLVMAYRPRKEGETLATAVTQTFNQLARQKQARPHKEPLLGLGVTQMCRSTALPAVGFTKPVANDPGTVYPASAEILAKLGANRLATGRLKDELPAPDTFSYPRDFEDLGREKGEDSHIAIVHADGNGIGQKFINLNLAYANNPNDGEYKEAVHSLSQKVQAAGAAALKGTLDALVRRLRLDETGYVIRHANKKGEGDLITRIVLRDGKEDHEGYFLPFRPLVFGGDDVTFVCDGRLGIALAAEYLKQFEAQTEAITGEKLTACAGIAIVKSRHPFARAYELADDLCSQAKKYRAQRSLTGSCLDWHFALTGLSGSIDEIRRREYTTYQFPEKLKADVKPPYRGESLTLRPLTLGVNPKESHRSFNVICAGVTAFQDNLPPKQDPESSEQEPEWSVRRNKVKALRDALREGPAAVRRFMIMYELKELPPIDGQKNSDFQFGGWWGGFCGYFDAVEMMDSYIPLEAQWTCNFI